MEIKSVEATVVTIDGIDGEFITMRRASEINGLAAVVGAAWDTSRIPCTKLIRNMTGLGLRESVAFGRQAHEMFVAKRDEQERMRRNAQERIDAAAQRALDTPVDDEDGHVFWSYERNPDEQAL